MNCEKLGLQLLYTCRQIYDEARLLPYSENVFAFNRYISFYHGFATYLTKDQAHAIRAISLLTDTRTLPALHFAFLYERYLRDVKRFTGLQVVHIRLVAIFAEPETLTDVCSTTRMQRYWVSDIYSLGIHKLKRVTVVITPKHEPECLDYDPEYPVEKKQLLAWAETMMTEMLGPWSVEKIMDLHLENHKAHRNGDVVSWDSLS